MKLKIFAIMIVLNLPSIAFASQGSNGANGNSGAIGPEIDCVLANGETKRLPALYCDIARAQANKKDTTK
ncbi:hypothetical protein C0W96_01105 [Photobacterium kishitanii]|uniref:hypothetical protein n=1 Tax=Photobacterium kishitanii TaxID=318456 RepID=UPI0005D46305|nr:hypothetical protein [Photobacterium kishitanii]KJG09529.1 hypothetical protein UB40_12500 [Photobacterium kishitanii]PSV07881.1 hypothetical protein C0W96_01105 [Photobacterium kishitanii]PSV76369.1 hypothetical protein C0W29_08345 [Photobacterium kishitanii]